MNETKKKLFPGKILSSKDFETPNLTIEEHYIVDVIKAARRIQEFLWADMNDESGLPEYGQPIDDSTGRQACSEHSRN